VADQRSQDLGALGLPPPGSPAKEGFQTDNQNQQKRQKVRAAFHIPWRFVYKVPDALIKRIERLIRKPITLIGRSFHFNIAGAHTQVIEVANDRTRRSQFDLHTVPSQPMSP